jgi:hypothetical protein
MWRLLDDITVRTIYCTLMCTADMSATLRRADSIARAFSSLHQ